MFLQMNGHWYGCVLWSLICKALCFGCGGSGTHHQTGNSGPTADFSNPELVEIIGYPSGSFQNIQEPFISRRYPPLSSV
jgi:hypothetical protein